MTKYFFFTLLFSLLLLAPRSFAATDNPCTKLEAKKLKQAETIYKTTYPYDCCDESLDRCLKQTPVCRLALRLRDHICRRLAAGQDEKQIKDSLDKRALSMTPKSKKAAIDLSQAPMIGPEKALITVVIYACARCPFCARVMPDLYNIVTNPPASLKGKIKLYFRPFPIKGHEGSVEGGLAYLAAAKQKKFWPYMLKLAGDYDNFKVDRLGEWAAQTGLNRGAFEADLKLSPLREALAASKKEGLALGVAQTPTLFINGRRYQGALDHDSLVDIFEEEAERLSGKGK